MNILVTGAAGFIGYNLIKLLLKKKLLVYGIDNFDNYYSEKYKYKRVKDLKKDKNFFFSKIDITDKKKIENYFKKKNIDFIVHLAAQAGVRHSLINPQKYIDVNIFGFLNVIEEARKNNIKNFFYASSSSVYGDTKKFPLKENQILNPKNIYGLSKKLNEQIALCYTNWFRMNCTGLRFFTVYGEWGRPDMFMYKLFKASKNNEVFYLNNYGNHKRDFTYINDVIYAIYKLILKKQKKNNIFNICSNKPIQISKIINHFKKKNNIKVKLIEMQKADVKDTHGSNSKLKKELKSFRISKFYNCFDKTYDWYKKNNIEKL